MKKRKTYGGQKVKCANCGKKFLASEYSLLSDAIQRHKPACSYECNKALGQAS